MKCSCDFSGFEKETKKMLKRDTYWILNDDLKPVCCHDFDEYWDFIKDFDEKFPEFSNYYVDQSGTIQITLSFLNGKFTVYIVSFYYNHGKKKSFDTYEEMQEALDYLLLQFKMQKKTLDI